MKPAAMVINIPITTTISMQYIREKIYPAAFSLFTIPPNNLAAGLLVLTKHLKFAMYPI